MGKTIVQRSKAHTMAQIAALGMTPVKSQPLGLPLDAKVQGIALAQEVFATLKQQHGTWVAFAHRVFALSTEARTAFVASCKTTLKGMREEVITANYPGADKKDKASAGKEIRVATVQVSRLTKISEAASEGASMIGLGKFYGVSDAHNIGYNRVYDYCVAYLAGQAAKKGRPVTTLASKAAKWLASAQKDLSAERDEEMVAADAKFAAELTKLLAKFNPAKAGE